jgi:hypothetical protein
VADANILQVNAGEDPDLIFEFFEDVEDGPAIDLTGATITVSHDLPGTLPG